MSEELENLENKSSWGGTRQNSGRPKGVLNKATLEKKIVEEEVRQRVLKNAQRLLDAQFSLAQGCSFLYQMRTIRFQDPVTNRWNTEKRTELIKDPETIRAYLDGEFDGGDDYYFITTQKPDNKAIDSLLDRTLGKPSQNVNIDGKLTNYNVNADTEFSPEEHEQVKQAILKSVEDSGSPE